MTGYPEDYHEHDDLPEHSMHDKFHGGIRTLERLVEIAYTSYGNVSGWRNSSGENIPSWADQHHYIKHYWRTAVRAVVTELERLP